MLAATLHGEIRKQGKWIYKDLGGLTGTQVNKKLICEKTVPISISDVFRIGAYEIEVLDYSK
ncbi:FHA domain-containing protein [archaeon]|nr:MAG: FHA domain-containing protein [archaeon]